MSSTSTLAPRIGAVALANPFILAPMAGLTNRPFRRLAKEYGAGLTVSEMASATALSFRGPATLRLIATDKAVESPYCVQLFGREPDRLALAAQMAVEAGADMVDLNMGCPARKVVRSGHGAALLKEPGLAVSLVRAMARAVNVPVTVKTRPCFAPGQGATVFELLPRLADAGAAAVTLHPRSAAQAFGGEADWSLVARLAENSPIPIIGSGDITTAAEAVERLDHYGAAAVMIGRAARGRPWLFRQCLQAWRGQPVTEAGLEERLAVATRHARLLAAEVGERKAPFMLRTVLMWYTKSLRGASEFRARLCREEDLGAQIELLRQCVAENRPPISG